MPDLIRVKRGNKANLPTLNDGEFGLSEDTKELFIGTTGGNLKLADSISGGHKIQSGTTGSISLTANASTTSSIVFPIAFSAISYVLNCQFVSASSGSSNGLSIQTASRSVGSAGITIYSTLTQTVNLDWIAIGT